MWKARVETASPAVKLPAQNIFDISTFCQMLVKARNSDYFSRVGQTVVLIGGLGLGEKK